MRAKNTRLTWTAQEPRACCWRPSASSGWRTGFYQASTSELYGLVQEIPQQETTPFPRSTYAGNGILFNHESTRRGETFVTRKIPVAWPPSPRGWLYMGNMSALRDWGHAKDYVRKQSILLQQDVAKDFDIATGLQYSVRQFVNWAAAASGITVESQDEGDQEHAVITVITGDATPVLKAGEIVLRGEPHFPATTQVETLLGDSSNAKKDLGWIPEITAQDMGKEMVANDLVVPHQHALFKSHGDDTTVATEHWCYRKPLCSDVLIRISLEQKQLS